MQTHPHKSIDHDSDVAMLGTLTRMRRAPLMLLMLALAPMMAGVVFTKIASATMVLEVWGTVPRAMFTMVVMTCFAALG